MRTQTWIFIFSLCLFTALGLLLLIVKPEQDISSPSKEPIRETPQARLLGTRLVEMEGDQRMWEANADQIEVFEDRNTTRISKLQRQIKLVLYRGEDTLTCYADVAEINNQNKEVNLLGNLMAQSRDGITLWTDSVTWLPQRKRLLTDKPVTIRRQGLVIQGLGMEADLALGEVKILSNIISSFEVSKGKFGSVGWGKIIE